MLDKQALDGSPLSQTYKDILTNELRIITNLHANEETKMHMVGTTRFPNLNVVETKTDITENQSNDQSKYPIPRLTYW